MDHTPSSAGLEFLRSVRTRIQECGLNITQLTNYDQFKHATSATPRPANLKSISAIANAIYELAHPPIGSPEADLRKAANLWQHIMCDLNAFGEIILTAHATEAEFRAAVLALFGFAHTPPASDYRPFTPRGAIQDTRDFFGRAYEFGLIRSNQGNFSPAQINGERKIGKSSFLLEAGRRLRSERWVAHPRFAYVDMTASDTHSLPGFFAAIASQWQCQERPATEAEFSLLCRRLREQEKQDLFIAIDEAEKFIDLSQTFTLDFFQNLRSLGQRCVTLWFGCKTPLREIALCGPHISPFNIARAIPLGLFSEAEAIGFLKSRPGVTFNSAETEAILKWAEHHACKLQIACQLVLLGKEHGRSLQEAIASAQHEWDSIRPNTPERSKS